MVRPADAPRRAEEGNPPDLNDRINPNNNNERARNNVRTRGMTRRNVEAVQEPVRDRVITRQIIQNMNRPWRRQANVNTEHNSMVLRSQTGGVPHNLRENRNQPRRQGITEVRSSASGMRAATQLLETLRSRSGSPATTGQQPGNSQAAAQRQLPLIQRGPGTMHELGNISATDLASPGTSRHPTRMETRSSTSRERSVPNRYRESEGRVFMPPTFWRPDLEDGSSSDDEATEEHHEEPIRPCPIFHFSRRLPTPASVLEAARAAEAEQRAQERRSNRATERNSARQKAQRCHPWMRPRRDGSSRFESEEDFVSSGYFPNPAYLRSNGRRQPAVNLTVHPQTDANRAELSSPALHRTITSARTSKKRRKAAKKGRKVRQTKGLADRKVGASNKEGRLRANDSSQAAKENGPSGSGLRPMANDSSQIAREDGPSGSGLRQRANDSSQTAGEDGPSGSGVRPRANDSSQTAREDGPSGSGLRPRANDSSQTAGEDGPSGSGVRPMANESNQVAREDGPSGSGVRPRANESNQVAREERPSGSVVMSLEERRQARQEAREARHRERLLAGREYSRRMAAREKRREKMMKDRDERREKSREKARAQAKGRREEERFQRRRINSNETDTEYTRQRPFALASRHWRFDRETDRFDRTQLPSTSGTVRQVPDITQLPSTSGTVRHVPDRPQLPSTSGTVRQLSYTALDKRKQAIKRSVDAPLDDEGSRPPDRTSQTSSTSSIGSQQPSCKKKRYEQGTRASLPMSDIPSTSTAGHDMPSPSASESDTQCCTSKSLSGSMKRKWESDGTSDEDNLPLKRMQKSEDGASSDEEDQRSVKRKRNSEDEAPRSGGKRRRC